MEGAPSDGGHGPAALRPGPGWVWRTQRGPFSHQASLWDSLSAPRATTRPLFWVRRRQAVAWGVLLRPGGAPVPSLWGEAVSGGRLGFLRQFPGRPGHRPLLYPAGQQPRFSLACAGVPPQSWTPRLGDTKWAVMRGVDWHFREDATGGGCPGKDVGAFLGVATPKLHPEGVGFSKGLPRSGARGQRLGRVAADHRVPGHGWASVLCPPGGPAVHPWGS